MCLINNISWGDICSISVYHTHHWITQNMINNLTRSPLLLTYWCQFFFICKWILFLWTLIDSMISIVAEWWIFCAGDSETFQIKKPKHSRHIAKQLKKASQREKEEVEEKKSVVRFNLGVSRFVPYVFSMCYLLIWKSKISRQAVSYLL